MIGVDLKKKANESDLQYHRRIVEGKLGGELADYDYKELSALAYGREYNSDHARKLFYGSKHTLDLMEKEKESGLNHAALSELEEKKIELRKERQKLKDERTTYNNVVREQARREELYEVLTAAISAGNLPELNYTPSPAKTSDNDLLVSLNDLHYGLVAINYWTQYDPDICRAMMGRYLDRIIEIGKLHGSQKVIVWNAGDAVSGIIHRGIELSNKENVIDQVKHVSELIAQFLAELSKHFTYVKYVGVSGNHSRITPNKKDAIIEERLDDLIGWYLEARLQNFDNVLVDFGERIHPSIVMMEVRGKLYVVTHGEFEGSDKKMKDLRDMLPYDVYAVLCGHKHHNKVDTVQGLKTIMGGSFVGVDDYCAQHRILGRPEQIVCVVDEDGVRATYDVALST